MPTTTAAPSSAGPKSLPSSIDVLGRSGATGYVSDPNQRGSDANENSWATGTNPEVNSIDLRVLAHNPAVKGHNFNLAKGRLQSGRSPTPVTDALKLVLLPDLFLIQTIDNDVRCDGTDEQSYAPFGSTLDQVLDNIIADAPGAQIFFASEWGTAESFANARRTSPEPSPPTRAVASVTPSTSQGKCSRPRSGISKTSFSATTTRSGRVAPSTPACRFDDGALEQTVVETSDITPDGHHLTIHGHKKFAELAWNALY